MSSHAYAAFAAALDGPNERVVQIRHPRTTFLAQNVNGAPALLARVQLPPGQTIEQGRGFAVNSQRIGDDSFVRIVSSEQGMSLLFLKLIEHILERTLSGVGPEDVARNLAEAIDEFRRFFGRKPGLLSEDEVRGLVAELLLLLHIRGDDPGRTWDVFDSWGGPFGAVHDFEFASGAAVEVKSTHRPASEVRISSPTQLQPLPDGLELVVLPLERIADGDRADVRFTELVARVAGVAKEHGGDVAELWEAALDALGLDISDEYYARWNFLCGDWQRFAVGDDFPTIKVADVPAGVTKVTFSLVLGELEEHRRAFEEMEFDA